MGSWRSWSQLRLQAKKCLRLQAKKSSSRRLQLLTLNFSFQLCKISLLIKIIYGSYCLYKLNRLHVYILLVLFAFIKDPAEAGAAKKKRLQLSAPTYKKIGSGSGAAPQLCNTGFKVKSFEKICGRKSCDPVPLRRITVNAVNAKINFRALLL